MSENITTAEQAADAAVAARKLCHGMGGHGSAYRAAHEAKRYARLAEELAVPERDAEHVFRAQAAEGACALSREYYDGKEEGLARPWVFTHSAMTVAVTLPAEVLATLQPGDIVWTACVTEDGMDLEGQRTESVEKVTGARITTHLAEFGDAPQERVYRRKDGQEVGSSKEKRPRTIYRVDYARR